MSGPEKIVYQIEVDSTSGTASAKQFTSEFESGLNKTNTAVTTTNTNLEKTAGITDELKTGIAALGLAWAAKEAVAFGYASVDAFATFEEGLNSIATLSPEAKAHVGEYKDAILAMSEETGQPLAALTKGMYDTLSGGVAAGDAVKFLGASSNLAIAGLSNTATTVGTLVSNLEAFGLEATDVEKMSDQLFATVQLGRTTVDELAGSVGRVSKLMDNAGGSTEDMFAAMAQLTIVLPSTSEATTQLKAMMTGLLKPTEEMSGLLESVGYETGKAAIEAVGFEGVLKLLHEATTTGGKEMTDLFESVEGSSAAMILATDNASKFSDNLDGITKSAGATKGAVEEMSDGIGFKMDKLAATFETIKVEIGEWGTGVVEIFTDLDSSTQKFVMYAGLAGIGATGFAGGLAALAIGGTAAYESIGKLSASLATQSAALTTSAVSTDIYTGSVTKAGVASKTAAVSVGAFVLGIGAIAGAGAGAIWMLDQLQTAWDAESEAISRGNKLRKEFSSKIYESVQAMAEEGIGLQRIENLYSSGIITGAQYNTLKDTLTKATYGLKFSLDEEKTAIQFLNARYEAGRITLAEYKELKNDLLGISEKTVTASSDEGIAALQAALKEVDSIKKIEEANTKYLETKYQSTLDTADRIKELTLSEFDYAILKLDEERNAKQKQGVDKTEIERWYTAEKKALIDERTKDEQDAANEIENILQTQLAKQKTLLIDAQKTEVARLKEGVTAAAEAGELTFTDYENYIDAVEALAESEAAFKIDQAATTVTAILEKSNFSANQEEIIYKTLAAEIKSIENKKTEHIVGQIKEVTTAVQTGGEEQKKLHEQVTKEIAGIYIDLAAAGTTTMRGFLVDALKGDIRDSQDIWEEYSDKILDMGLDFTTTWLIGYLKIQAGAKLTAAEQAVQAMMAGTVNEAGAEASEIAWAKAYAVMTMGASLVLVFLTDMFGAVEDVSAQTTVGVKDAWEDVMGSLFQNVQNFVDYLDSGSIQEAGFNLTQMADTFDRFGSSIYISDEFRDQFDALTGSAGALGAALGGSAEGGTLASISIADLAAKYEQAGPLIDATAQEAVDFALSAGKAGKASEDWAGISVDLAVALADVGTVTGSDLKIFNDMIKTLAEVDDRMSGLQATSEALALTETILGNATMFSTEEVKLASAAQEELTAIEERQAEITTILAGSHNMLDGEVAALQTELTGLNTRATEVEGTLYNITGAMDGTGSSTGELTTDTSAMSAALSELETNAGTASTALSPLTSDFSELATDVGTAATSVDSLNKYLAALPTEKTISVILKYSTEGDTGGTDPGDIIPEDKSGENSGDNGYKTGSSLFVTATAANDSDFLSEADTDAITESLTAMMDAASGNSDVLEYFTGVLNGVETGAIQTGEQISLLGQEMGRMTLDAALAGDASSAITSASVDLVVALAEIEGTVGGDITAFTDLINTLAEVDDRMAGLQATSEALTLTESILGNATMFSVDEIQAASAAMEELTGITDRQAEITAELAGAHNLSTEEVTALQAELTSLNNQALAVEDTLTNLGGVNATSEDTDTATEALAMFTTGAESATEALDPMGTQMAALNEEAFNAAQSVAVLNDYVNSLPREHNIDINVRYNYSGNASSAMTSEITAPISSGGATTINGLNIQVDGSDSVDTSDLADKIVDTIYYRSSQGETVIDSAGVGRRIA